MTLLLGGRPTSRNRVGLSFARLNPLNERPRCTRTSQGELYTPPTPQFVQEIKRYDPPQAIVGSGSAAHAHPKSASEEGVFRGLNPDSAVRNLQLPIPAQDVQKRKRVGVLTGAYSVL